MALESCWQGVLATMLRSLALAVFFLVSLSRAAALYKGYHAPLDVYATVCGHECLRCLHARPLVCQCTNVQAPTIRQRRRRTTRASPHHAAPMAIVRMCPWVGVGMGMRQVCATAGSRRAVPRPRANSGLRRQGMVRRFSWQSRYSIHVPCSTHAPSLAACILLSSPGLPCPLTRQSDRYRYPSSYFLPNNR